MCTKLRISAIVTEENKAPETRFENYTNDKQHMVRVHNMLLLRKIQ